MSIAGLRSLCSLSAQSALESDTLFPVNQVLNLYYIYTDTCSKSYVVGSSNIKIQNVSQSKLLICITNQVSSHCDAEITIETRRSNPTNPKGTHPVPTSESACSKLKKTPSAFGLCLCSVVELATIFLSSGFAGLQTCSSAACSASGATSLISVHPVLCKEKKLYECSFRDTEVLL